MFKIVKQMRKARKDIVGMKHVSERRGSHGKVGFFFANRDK